jgi:hypothetical protein
MIIDQENGRRIHRKIGGKYVNDGRRIGVSQLLTS